jgi:hypothetical protein
MFDLTTPDKLLGDPRRGYIAGLGSAAAWPVVTRAQQPALPVVGFLDLRSPKLDASDVVAFRQGLAAAGFVEGRTLTIEYRWQTTRGGGWRRLRQNSSNAKWP